MAGNAIGPSSLAGIWIARTSLELCRHSEGSYRDSTSMSERVEPKSRERN